MTIRDDLRPLDAADIYIGADVLVFPGEFMGAVVRTVSGKIEDMRPGFADFRFKVRLLSGPESGQLVWLPKNRLAREKYSKCADNYEEI